MCKPLVIWLWYPQTCCAPYGRSIKPRKRLLDIQKTSQFFTNKISTTNSISKCLRMRKQHIYVFLNHLALSFRPPNLIYPTLWEKKNKKTTLGVYPRAQITLQPNNNTPLLCFLGKGEKLYLGTWGGEEALMMIMVVLGLQLLRLFSVPSVRG